MNLNNEEINKYDIRKLPPKPRESLKIDAKIEGKWISFYNKEKNLPLTKPSPYYFSKVIRPLTSKKTNSMQKRSSSLSFPDRYQIYQNQIDILEQQQNLKLEPIHSKTPIKSIYLSSIQLVNKNEK